MIKKKSCGISIGLGSSHWNFPGIHKTLWNRVSKGEVVPSPNFPRVKWQIQNFQGFFQKRIIPPPPPPYLIFSRIPHLEAGVFICLEISSLEHEIFCFAKIKFSLNVIKHKHLHAICCWTSSTGKTQFLFRVCNLPGIFQITISRLSVKANKSLHKLAWTMYKGNSVYHCYINHCFEWFYKFLVIKFCQINM